jgi:hypothetical protein
MSLAFSPWLRKTTGFSMRLRTLGLTLALCVSASTGSQARHVTTTLLLMPLNGAVSSFDKHINPSFGCNFQAGPSIFLRPNYARMTNDAVISMPQAQVHYFPVSGPASSAMYTGTAYLAFDDSRNRNAKTGIITFDVGIAGVVGQPDPPKSFPFKLFSQTLSTDGVLTVSFIIEFTDIPGMPSSCDLSFHGVYRTKVLSHTDP